MSYQIDISETVSISAQDRCCLCDGGKTKYPYEPVPGQDVEEPEVLDSVTGALDPDASWLKWNSFIARDVLGAYNNTIKEAVLALRDDIKIGPIPGGMQWPLFNAAIGPYPPMNFGDHGFNLLSFYYYPTHWQPSIMNLFWAELAKAGNPDLPLNVMPETYYGETSDGGIGSEKAYIFNNFFLLVAGGADGLNYFRAFVTQNKFWEAVSESVTPVVDKFGPLLARLEPQKYRMGLLVPWSMQAYKSIHLLRMGCAYTNMLRAHLDVDLLVEEEITNTELANYEGVFLFGVEWLSEPVHSLLSEQALDEAGVQVFVDATSQVVIDGSVELFVDDASLDFSTFNTAHCLQEAQSPDIAHIKTAVHQVLAEGYVPDVTIDQDTVIYRKFEAGGVEYLWLVNVHNEAEINYLNNFVTPSNVAYDVPVLEACLSNTAGADACPALDDLWHWDTGAPTVCPSCVLPDYLPVYGPGGAKCDECTQPAYVEIKDNMGLSVVDVLSGQVLSATNDGTKTGFHVEIPRLQGKLIALYPSLPSTLNVTAPDQILNGEPQSISIEVNSSLGSVPVVPLQIRLIRPDETEHPYSQYNVTEDGVLELELILGAHAQPGTWTLQVTELSTQLEVTKSIEVFSPCLSSE